MPPKATIEKQGKRKAASLGAAPSPAEHAARRSIRPKPSINYNEERILDAAEAANESLLRGGGVKERAAAILDILVTRPIPTSEKERAALLPKQDPEGRYIFPDYPAFRPNLSPEEVLKAGSFGGTYFRPIRSSVFDGKVLERAWEDEVSTIDHGGMRSVPSIWGDEVH